jgi:hypothetical protein
MYHEHDVVFFADAGRNFCLWLNKVYTIEKYGLEAATAMFEKEEEARAAAQAEKQANNTDTPAPTINIILTTADSVNQRTPTPEAASRGSQHEVSTRNEKSSQRPGAKSQKSKAGKGKRKAKAAGRDESEASAASSDVETSSGAGTGWEEEFVADEEDDEAEKGVDGEEPSAARPSAPRKARVSQYEIEREANIQRNEQLLGELAVRFGGTEQLFRDKPKPRPVTRKKKVPQPPVSPSSLRRSSRHATQDSQKVKFFQS